MRKVFTGLTVTISVFSALLLTACSPAIEKVDVGKADKTAHSDVQSPSEKSAKDSTPKDATAKDSSVKDSATQTGTQRCSTSELNFEITRDQGAAGKVFYVLAAKNIGDTACVLAGYPGVSFVDQSGNQVGLAAERTGKSYEPISLGSGQEAHTTLIVGNADNYSGCGAQSVGNVKIIPPEETRATVAPVDLRVCSSEIANVQIDPFGAK